MNKKALYLKKILTPFVRFAFPVTFFGEKVKEIPDKRSLMIANHVSGWDPVIFTLYTPINIVFLYKIEFRKSKFLSWAFDSLDEIGVRRGETDMHATRQILSSLKNNRVLWFFPEGTRNRDLHNLLPFKHGAALFALKTQAPLRPIVTWDIYKAFHRNYVYIGEEFDLSEYYNQPITKELLVNVTRIIYEKLFTARVKLEAIMKEKGIKRRKLSKKEQAKISASISERQEEYAQAKRLFGDIEERVKSENE